MPFSLSLIPEAKRGNFIVGNVIRMCIDDDKRAAGAALRARLKSYFLQPQYPNYWIEAGYEEEMAAALAAVKAKDLERLDTLMTDEWLADVALYGDAPEVLDGVEAWHDAGVTILSIDPISTSGSEERAFDELFETFART